MKHIPLMSFLFLLTFLVSCKKTSTSAISIQGVWELRHLEGGYGPGGSPDFKSGNGYIWKFRDSTYQQYSNGQLTSSDSYTLVKENTVATGKIMDAMIFDQNSYTQFSFKIKNNILTLYRGVVAADGTIETYERIEK